MFFLSLSFLPIFIQTVLMLFGINLFDLIGKAETIAIAHLLYLSTLPFLYFIRKSVTVDKTSVKARFGLKTHGSKAFVAGTVCIVTLVASILIIPAVYTCIAYFWISPDPRFSDFPESPFFHFLEHASVILTMIFVISGVLYLWWPQQKPEAGDTPD